MKTSTALLILIMAAMPIDSGVSPFTGTYKPYKALSAFHGLDPLGEWVLDIYDAKAGNTGSLDAWTLVLYTGEIYGTTGVRPELPAGPEGIYFVRLRSGSSSLYRKMLLLD